MPKHQTNSAQSKHFHRKLLIGSSIIVFVLLLITELFILGNIPYYLKWRECGRQPVMVTRPVSIGFGAQPQKYFAYPRPGFFDSKASWDDGPIFYCSLDEAQQKYGIDLQIQD